MKQDLCICALAPSYPLRTRVSLLVHWREAETTSNSGRIALLGLPNGRMRICGGEQPRLEREELFREGEQSLLLYPAPGARRLTPELARELRGEPVHLLVPDGTWTTARKVVSREPLLKALPAIALPEGERSAYSLRHSPHPERVATLEALARALALLEGRPDVRAGLEAFFAVMVERVLYTRGKLKASELVHRRS